MDVLTLLGSALGLGLMAGLRLYATVFLVGLAIRFGIVDLHSSMAGLAVLAHPYVLAAAGIGCLFEFFADKIPLVDSVWDTIHTFIRPLGAAVLGVTAIGSVAPEWKVVIFLLCGGVALTSHSAKAGTRLAANHSPEPVSNWTLSAGEDLLVAGGTWLALTHPVIAFFLVLLAVALAVWLLRHLHYALGRWRTAVADTWRRVFHSPARERGSEGT